MSSIIELIIIAPPILFALTFHEYAHAYVAYRLGDPTAKDMGRLTLNPISHLDPVGTIMLFIARIGWAKPVPINPLNFKNPLKDVLWVSLAGPGANLLAAFALGLLCRSFGITSLRYIEMSFFGILKFMIGFGLLINLVLAFFNFIPVPPLDGSKILMGLLPPKSRAMYESYLNYGPMLLVGLLAFGFLFRIPILWYIIMPFVKTFSILFAGADLS